MTISGHGVGTRHARRPRFRRPQYAETITGLFAMAGSFVSPIGYDEAYWLAIARMVLGGRHLYDTALDNKTPLVHLVTWIVDIAPGPFSLARGIVVGLAVGWITRQFQKIASSNGTSALAPLVGGAMVATLSQFHITTELLALACLAVALNTMGPNRAAFLALAAAGFDPRSLLLIPAVALWRAGRNRDDLRAFLARVGVGSAAATAVVLLIPNLRYGLLELSLSIREFEWGSMGSAALVYSLPLLALIGAGLRPTRTLASASWLIGALAIPVLSLIPFDHYWTYLASASVLTLAGPAKFLKPAWPVIFALAFTPLVIRGYDEHRANRLLLSDQLQSAELIQDSIGDLRFLYVGASPFLAMKLPNQALLRSPTAYYLIYPTPRSEQHHQELPRLLDSAEAFVLDIRNGILIFDQESVIKAFPCSFPLEYTEVRLRVHHCP